MQNIMKDVKEILETGKVGNDKGFKSWGSRIIARSLQDGWVYGAELRDLKEEEGEQVYNIVIQILNKYNVNIAEGRIKQMRNASETAKKRTKEEVLAELNILTKKQIVLGVTSEDLQGAKEAGLLNNYSYFKAWASTLKKGQYNISDLLKKEGMISYHAEEMKRYFAGLAINFPNIFHTGFTHNLDIVTVKR